MTNARKLRVLLLGRRGQLGSELERLLGPMTDLTAWGREALDLSRTTDIGAAVRTARPELVINAAGYTNVDRAESEAQVAMSLNASAPGAVAAACVEVGAKMLHFSTDYVFDGEAGREYVETDAPKPLQVYGRTKRAGEVAVLTAGGGAMVWRTSWLYHLGYPSFPRRVLGWARGQKEIQIVGGQVSCPTWATRLAMLVAGAIENGALVAREGLYHVAGGGQCSRYEWAMKTLELDPRRDEHVVETVTEVNEEAFGGARRPRRSALDCSKFDADFGLDRGYWEEDLLTALKGLGALSRR